MQGFNEAVRLCRLEWLKKLAGLDAVITKTLMNDVCCENEGLIKAITEHFTKGE